MNDHAYNVFISYRREGGEMLASVIYEELRNLGYDVFWDQKSLGNGFFDEKLISTLHHCTDVVLVLSSNTLQRCITDEDDWVRREIRFALEHKINIVPIQIGGFTWPDNLPEDIKDIRRCNGVETTEHYLRQDIEHRLATLLNASPRKNKDVLHTLSSHIEHPKQLFIGRQEELSEIHRILTTETNYVFIQGMGGIGKSEIARAYAKRYRTHYDSIVFSHYEGSLLQTFINDNIFNISGIERLISDAIKMESRENYFYRKLGILKNTAIIRKVLIIIDNFDVSENELSAEFDALIDSNCKIIFTSRTDFSEYYPTIQIPCCNSKEFAEELFLAYSGKRNSQADPAVGRLLEYVQYHTFTIELMAKHMLRANVKPDKMLTELQEHGAKALSSKINLMRNHSSKDTAFSFISALFKTEQLSACEKDVLSYMAYMPISGVSIDNFLKWTDIVDSSVIHDLCSRSWLSINYDTNYVTMHAIVKDVVLDKLLPNENIRRTLLNTSLEIWDSAQKYLYASSWVNAIKELLIIYPWVCALEGDSTMRTNICISIAKCYDQLTCFSEAYEFYREVCDRYISDSTQIPPELFPVFRRYSYCMENGKNIFGEAYALRKKLLDLVKKSASSTEELLPFYEDIANSAVGLGQHKEAHAIRKYVYEQYKESPSCPIGKVIYAKSAYANALDYIGSTEEAYSLREEICSDIERHWGKEHDAYHVACSNLACCAISAGNSAKAVGLLQTALRKITQSRGEKDFYTLCICTNLGAALCHINDCKCIQFNKNIHECQSDVWGFDYDVTLKTFANLASAYLQNGDVTKAYDIEKRAIIAIESVKEAVYKTKQQLLENHRHTELILEGSSVENIQRTWFTVILQLPSIL